MRRPMPSPNGTNNARLYLPSRPPVAAYDAANGVNIDLADKIANFLQGKISDEDLKTVGNMLGRDNDSYDAEPDEQDAAAKAKIAQDARRRAANRTAAGAASYAMMFPNAERFRP